MDLNIITSLSVIFTCLSLLTLMIFINSKYSTKSYFVLYLVYGIIGIGSYIALTMFQTTSVIIKKDVIDSIANTENYVGFNDPTTIVIISCIGAILGAIWYKINKIMKKVNMNDKK